MKPGEVTRIPITNLEPNPHNPRLLFDDEPLIILLESIREVGVLVPITVYPKEDKDEVDPKKDRFIILDGERRWRCVNKLERYDIPAIIVERPTDVQNILIMFNIHNLREPWMLMPTALKLQTLMDKLKETNERKLAELTKLSVSQIRRCKILLTYPKKYHDMLLAPPSERLKADFFIDLHRIRRPALEEELPFWKERGDEKCIDIFLSKYRNEVIESVTAPRIIASLYRGAQNTKQLDIFNNEMEKFLSNPNMKVEEIIIPGVEYEKIYQELKRSTMRLQNQIIKLDVEAISANEDIINILTNLVSLIQSRLDEAQVTRPE